MNRKERRQMPLQRKVRYFTVGYSLFLLAVIFCCILLLYQNMESSERLLGKSYLQSGALSQISEANRLLAEYGEYPDLSAQEEIRKTLAEGARMLSGLPRGTGSGSSEARMLTTAIGRTYESFQDSVERLFAMPVSSQPDQAFYVCCYETLEIGGYVDAYLKQLTTETLKNGYSSYEWQKGFFRAAILGLAVFAAAVGAAMLRLNQWFTRRVVRPVFALADAAKSMAASQMDIPDLPVERGDEIGGLTMIFNRMKHDCQKLLFTQQKLAESRIAMLRQQINPHFLFNALSLISNVSAEEEAGQTGELIRRLSLLLRRAIYTKEEWISLRQELETLNSYIYIQEMRFADRLIFWIDCQVRPEEYMVPAFLLQPLVENAISHGIGNRGEHDPAAQHSGVGVLNVAERVRLLDPKSRFRIYSRPGMGTCVRIDFAGKERMA